MNHHINHSEWFRWCQNRSTPWENGSDSVGDGVQKVLKRCHNHTSAYTIIITPHEQNVKPCDTPFFTVGAGCGYPHMEISTIDRVGQRCYNRGVLLPIPSVVALVCCKPPAKNQVPKYPPVQNQDYANIL